MRVSEPQHEVAELRHGITLGLDPQPTLDPVDGDGLAATRPSSWWNHTRCRNCGHTFRRGDRVRVDRRNRTVVHLVPGLGCAESDDVHANQEALEEIAAFGAGLLSKWPTARHVRVHRLAAGDWRIPEGPGDLRDSNVCLGCGHTFRAGEHVVICPCQAARAPAGGRTGEPACGRAVHRDPAIGLSCWESWRPDGNVPVCPVTQVKVDEA